MHTMDLPHGEQVELLTAADLPDVLDAWTGKIAGRIAVWFVLGGAALVATAAGGWVTQRRDVADVRAEVTQMDGQGTRAEVLRRARTDSLLLDMRYELRRVNDRLDVITTTINDLRRAQ